MKRNTIILTALLAFLGAAAWLVTRNPGEQSADVEEGKLLVVVDSLSVDKISVKSASGFVSLEKQGVEWFITAPLRYRADQSALSQLLHQAKHMNIKNVVSSKPEKQAVFQVDSSGTSVTVSQAGREVASFVIGKNSPSYSEQYVRLTNSNDVVLVDGSFGYVFNRPLKDWRDKNIAVVPRDQILDVRYQYGDTTFTVTFKDSVWMVGKDSVQEGVMGTLLGALTTVTCDDFIDVPPAKPAWTAQISYAGIQLRFAYDAATSKYRVQSSMSPQWFTMESWRANQLLKRKREIVRETKRK